MTKKMVRFRAELSGWESFFLTLDPLAGNVSIVTCEKSPRKLELPRKSQVAR
ncbi:peptide-methionine (S)-S-oxide reductase [Schaalia cardiffensis F0333]|uniref:Peptide-methionine (S)-S-oxide reductase n=1 Tax=Schaalia cardiffensis F0333 TaxID=888050 RepID=N6WF85_9ACTO|nr:peptide-methionine (S)-S-oxide reductase [Schaalia cardiffensis F0333]